MNKNVASDGYWFYLEPYVYVNMKVDKALLMNMLDWQGIIVENKQMLMLLGGLFDRSNGGVVYLGRKDFLENKQCIEIIREKFMGDIIPVRRIETRPIQFVPQINIITEGLCKSKVLYRSRRELSKLVNEVSLFVSTQCDIKCKNCDKYNG